MTAPFGTFERYPYSAAGQAKSLSPQIEITLTGLRGKSVTDSALVDSGASHSAFPVSWMPRLGVSLKSCRPRKVPTAGGLADQWRYRRPLAASVAGKDFRVAAIFSDTPIAILGRDDFFLRFMVAFDQQAQVMYLKPHDEPLAAS